MLHEGIETVTSLRVINPKRRNLSRGEKQGQPAAGAGSGARKGAAVRARGTTPPGLRIVLALALAAGGGACAKRPVSTTKTGADPRDAAHRAYLNLVESVGIDVGAVAGKVIVLDPGHGGGYRGARGTGGTAEADVNLAVALFLWGLLSEAGADVHMTRTADKDLLPGAELHPPGIQPLPSEPPASPGPPSPPLADPDSLASELAARVRAANALRPDLFLSIHHNADASGDTTQNQTLTFYRLGDAGPSLDAAHAIHRHLMRNLGTQSGRVLAGNYHVLRNSSATAAVLGEPSFITNPIFEAKLNRIDRVELEATAYFLGIVDYFSRGTAKTLLTTPRPGALTGAPGIPALELAARFIGSPIDPSTVAITLDGEPVSVTRVVSAVGETSAVTYVGSVPALKVTNGPHLAQVRARCVGGNAAAPGELRLVIERPPAAMSATAWPPWNGRTAAGWLGLEVAVRDRFGLAVADSTLVEVRSPVRDSARTRDGKVWFRVTDRSPSKGQWQVRAGGVEVTHPVQSPGTPPAATGIVRGRIPGSPPVAGAELRDDEGGPVLGHTNPDGHFAVAAPQSTLFVLAPGYLATKASATGGGPTEIVLPPVLDGVLIGRVIAIDAAGGGSDPIAVSPTGFRAADATLAIAADVAAALRQAGARIALTREDDRTLPELARVEVAERAAANLVVRIGADPAPRIRHYPGSQRGADVAARIGEELRQESGLDLLVESEVTPILQATSAPAVEVLLPTPADVEKEELLLDRAFVRRVSRAIVLAIAGEAGLRLDAQGTAVLASRGRSVLLDGRQILAAPAAGPVLARALEPEPAWHQAAALDSLGEAGPVSNFSVAAGDTVELEL